MRGKSDYLFLGGLGLLIINTAIQSYLYGYLLSFNNYLGFAGWSIVLALRLRASKFKRQAMGWLLILGTLNVFSFTLGKITLSVGNISETGAEAIGLNPLIAVLLIAYYLVNKASIKRMLSNTFHGTKEEQETEREKQIQFYLNKFSECDSEELVRLSKNFDDYPQVAQIALRQIQAQKENTL